VQVMKADEARHAEHAQEAGARALPAPVKAVMRMASAVMKAVAYRV
jgi:3-demethoxyubiquinol 3-hydroxylase